MRWFNTNTVKCVSHEGWTHLSKVQVMRWMDTNTVKCRQVMRWIDKNTDVRVKLWYYVIMIPQYWHVVTSALHILITPTERT